MNKLQNTKYEGGGKKANRSGTSGVHIHPSIYTSLHACIYTQGSKKMYSLFGHTHTLKKGNSWKKVFSYSRGPVTLKPVKLRELFFSRAQYFLITLDNIMSALRYHTTKSMEKEDLTP
jgi:hypothetical protein